MILNDDVLLLPAPRPEQLISPDAAPAVGVGRHHLSAQEEAFLVTAYQHHVIVAESDPMGNDPERRYFPVSMKHHRNLAENLVFAGYLEKHTNARKFWYRLTEAGIERARSVAGEFSAGELPVPLFQGDDLEFKRKYDAAQRYVAESLLRLARDLLQEGYMLHPEPGRGINGSWTQIAFFSLFGGKPRLFRLRVRWDMRLSWKEIRYYPPTAQPDTMPALLEDAIAATTLDF